MTSDPITREWLLSIGFLPDGDDDEFGLPVWSVSEEDGEDEDRIQILVSTKDGSIWLEVYDKTGETMALVEVPGGSKERVLKVCEALKGSPSRDGSF